MKKRLKEHELNLCKAQVVHKMVEGDFGELPADGKRTGLTNKVHNFTESEWDHRLGSQTITDCKNEAKRIKRNIAASERAKTKTHHSATPTFRDMTEFLSHRNGELMKIAGISESRCNVALGISTIRYQPTQRQYDTIAGIYNDVMRSIKVS